MGNKLTLSNALKQRIRAIAKQQNISINKLSLVSGVAYSTLSSFLNSKDASITLSTLYKVCEGLNISLQEFFDDEMFENLIDGRKE